MNAVAVRQPKALVFGGLSLTGDGLVVEGKPKFTDWRDAINATVYLEEKTPRWSAALLAYGRKREDWAQWIDQVIDSGTFTKRTVDQYVYVHNNTLPEDWVDGVSFSHHAAVVALPSADKRILLRKAKTDHLSVSELLSEVRKVRHVKILKGQASELAKAQDRVARYAEHAIEACRGITRDDCKKAERMITHARRALDSCEAALVVFRKAVGK